MPFQTVFFQKITICNFCCYHICLLAKKCVNSFLHEYYQKLILGISFFYIHQQIPYYVYVQKNFFSNFFHFSFLRYCRFRRFFSKKQQYVTFVVVNFCYHATYRWKALDEQISNIYTFMGETPSIFWYTDSYHICLLAKKSVNSLLHEYFQNLILGFSFFYIHQ